MLRNGNKSQGQEIERKEFTDFICQMRIPQTRILGKVASVNDSPEKPRSKNFNQLSKLTTELIIPHPDITAMQISHDEDFMIIGSSGIFEKLQGIDILNIVWQQALMDASKPGGKVSAANIVDTLINLAALKR